LALGQQLQGNPGQPTSLTQGQLFTQRTTLQFSQMTSLKSMSSQNLTLSLLQTACGVKDPQQAEGEAGCKQR
jgi:hypothetical protein